MLGRILQHKWSEGTSALQMMLILRQLSLITVAILLPKYFNIQDIGAIESLQYLITTFSIFWINGLIQWLLPAYQNLTTPAQQKLLLQRFFVTFSFLSIAIILAIFINQNLFFAIFFQKTPYSFTDLFLWYAFFFLPTYVLEYVFFLKKQHNQILLIGIFTFIIQNSAILIAWKFDLGIEGIIKIWCLLAVLRYVLLVYNIGINRYVRPLNIRPALALIAYAFVAQWATTFDGWLVNWYYKGDAQQFAIFRYGAREFPLLSALTLGLSAAMAASIAQDLTQGLAQLKAKTARLAHLLFPISIILLLSSDIWFPYAFSTQFNAAIVLFDVYLCLILGRMLFPQSVAVAIGAHRALLWITLIELGINIILSSIFVHIWGMVGILLGTIIASWLEKIFIALWLKYKYQIDFKQYTPIGIYVGYGILFVLVLILKYW